MGVLVVTKDQFNSLEVIEQVEYINNQLENNSTLTLVCKELGVGRSTIRDRFKKFDYSYSKDLNSYVHNEGITDVVRNIKTENKESITDVIQEENNVCYTYIKPMDTVENIINKSDVEVKETLLDIVNNYDVLKEIIELHRRNTSVIKQQIVIEIEEAESKLTTLRVNSKELELFNEFCDVYKQYRKIDLISQALREFRLKYK